MSANDLVNGQAALAFAIQQRINAINTLMLVQVTSCTNDGGLSAVGSVELQPLMIQVDSAGTQSDYPPMTAVPYLRIQGGANAVICDPQPGDIGIAGFCSQDSSGIKRVKGKALAGSLRRFDLSDGLYLGSCLNGAPSQYVQFSSAGITIHSPTKVQITAPQVEITASGSMTITTPLLTLNGSLTATGSIASGTVILGTHTHSGVTSGNQSSGPPNP